MIPASITIAHPSGIIFEFIWVEGGEFVMGDDASEFDREKPSHRVKLSGFYIGKYPVTQSQWEAVTGGNSSRFKGTNRPVEMVSWHETLTSIHQLNHQTGQRFRLPTEAEWEYAARGGKYSQGYVYSGSDKLKQVGWYAENSNGKTHEVGLLLGNELGIHDMSGNVWEWCSDANAEDYYRICQQQGIVENPQGQDIGSGAERMLRGGSSFDSALHCRVASRGASPPGYRLDNIGFRLCFSPSVSG